MYAAGTCSRAEQSLVLQQGPRHPPAGTSPPSALTCGSRSSPCIDTLHSVTRAGSPFGQGAALCVPGTASSVHRVAPSTAPSLVTRGHVLITAQILHPHSPALPPRLALHQAPCSPFITTTSFITHFIR